MLQGNQVCILEISKKKKIITANNVKNKFNVVWTLFEKSKIK